METIKALLEQYESLKLNEVIDFNKFNEFAIVHHSAGIEGSTLTETDTQLLLNEGITPKGKPLAHSLMVKDHYQALKFVLEEATKKQKAKSIEFIQQINAIVMKSTGSIKNTVFGKIDETKGEFRKGNVSAGNSYFVNFEKVIPYTRDLVENINAKLNETPDPLDQLELAFSAHFDLVTIHPFYDGNGRTSRLLMNYIQAVNNVPLSIVYKEDRMEYIQALKDARSSKNIKLFIAFMFKQFEKQLSAEITLYKENINASKKPGDKNGFSLFF